MIESIEIKDVATYVKDAQVLIGLSKFNYFFGSNGSGKTTVSRIIENVSNFPTCKVTWKGGTPLQPMVYNSDFVERNFNQSTELKGVFTLGEEQVDTLAKITTAKGELDGLTKKLETLTDLLQGSDGTGGKKGELVTLETNFKDDCWRQKQQFDGKLQGAFEGYRGSAEKFKNKVLLESNANTATLETREYLYKKAESVFGPTPNTEVSIAEVVTAKLINHEANPILKKPVIGKENVDIAAIITKLSNSDWVREGRSFYDVSREVCPFCQQKTSEAFSRSLNEYFNETFVADCNAIDDLAINYAADATQLQQQLTTIIASSSNFLDAAKLKIEKELLDIKIALNNQRLALKKKEASQVVELESLSNGFSNIKSLIDSANTQIVAHNKMVANLETERATLTTQVWKFVLEALKTDLAAFKTKKSTLDKAIVGMTEQITTTRTNRAKKCTEIRDLEKQTTSIQPTIDGINQLLTSFGFEGFKLTTSESGTSYKLVRTDGTDAKTTMSEGEKTFVTFLYFYHLLKGSESDSGVTVNRIIVFDDPVSSLDSDILFIVGSLIKGLLGEVRTGTSHIRQVFVLTHNVYFHKEVTYRSNRKNGPIGEETFWIVKKIGQESKVQRHLTNPIKTSYELLWEEVRKPEDSSLTIQNTLRRILEHYFKILGGIEFDQLSTTFMGRDKIICKSLCSWLHDGSHYAHDDLYVSTDDSLVENYLKVFRAVFENSNHAAHYKMMMGDAYVEIADVNIPI